MIPFLQAHVEVVVDNQEDIITWIEDALRKEGVQEEAFQEAIIENSTLDNDGIIMYYNLNDWKVVVADKSITFRLKKDLHRENGPAIIEMRDDYNRVKINAILHERFYKKGYRFLFPEIADKRTFEDYIHHIFYISQFGQEVTFIIIENSERQLMNLDLKSSGITLEHHKEIVKYLKQTYNLSTQELLLHPDCGVRWLAEQTLESK